MKKVALGFTFMLAVSPLFAWSFGSNNSNSGFSFGNGPNSSPNSGSSWSFGNRPNSGSNWNENFNESFNFSEGFSFGDGFNFGSGPNFNSGWGNRGYGNNYRPYVRDGFHRTPGSGFNFGNNSRPYWNQAPNYGAGQPLMWAPPTYPAYMMPPPPMYYYPVPALPQSAPKVTQPAAPAVKKQALLETTPASLPELKTPQQQVPVSQEKEAAPK